MQQTFRESAPLALDEHGRPRPNFRRDAGPAVARHPHLLLVHVVAVQGAAAAVLVHEGVEGGEQSGMAVDLLDHLIRPLQERLGESG